MKCDKKLMELYAVTDRSWLNGATLAEQVEKTLKGGATLIQLREKTLNEEDFIKEAINIKKICGKYNVPLLINDNINVALKSNADGVHIGQSDMELIEARKLLGENKLIGVSTQTLDQAIKAEENGADYLGVGAVFSTSTKDDADSVTFETLRKICSGVSIPVCAIGGINKENICQLKGSNVDGIAVVSAIFAAIDIEKESKELLKIVEDMKK